MNRKKIIGSTELFVFNCFKASIPLRIIAEAVNLNTATIDKFLKGQKLPKELKEFKHNSNEEKVHLLKIYSWILADRIDTLAAFGPEVFSLLKPIYRYLKLNEWEAYLNGVIVHHIHSAKHRFVDVPDGYQKLINEILPPSYIDADGAGLLECFLVKSHKEDEQLFPQTEEINNIKKALNKCLDFYFAEEERGLEIDSKMVEYINVLMENMSERERKCILSKYGIECSFEEVMAEYKIGRERVRNLAERNLKILKRQTAHLQGLIKLKSFLEFQREKDDLQLEINMLKKEKEALEGTMIITNEHISNLVAFIKNERGNVPQKTLDYFEVSLIDEKKMQELSVPTLNLNQNRNLLLPFHDLDLSVRAYNILKDGLKIKFLWQLCELEWEDLYKQRNFGKKTHAELDQNLREMGLQMNMQFGQFRYLLIAKTGE